MIEAICEKDVVCVNGNGYTTAVQEVNVIVNRSSDNVLRKCKLFLSNFIDFVDNFLKK